jgi:hypothetical protein
MPASGRQFRSPLRSGRSARTAEFNGAGLAGVRQRVIRSVQALVLKDRDGARPACRSAPHFVRKARNRVSIGWKYFEIVELLQVAIADITTGFVAFPDQGSVAGRNDFVRGMTEGGVPRPRVRARHSNPARG